MISECRKWPKFLSMDHIYFFLKKTTIDALTARRKCGNWSCLREGDGNIQRR